MKRSFRNIAVLLLCCCMTGVFIGCNSDPSTDREETPATYTVTFNANGGTFDDDITDIQSMYSSKV